MIKNNNLDLSEFPKTKKEFIEQYRSDLENPDFEMMDEPADQEIALVFDDSNRLIALCEVE